MNNYNKFRSVTAAASRGSVARRTLTLTRTGGGGGSTTARILTSLLPPPPPPQSHNYTSFSSFVPSSSSSSSYFSTTARVEADDERKGSVFDFYASKKEEVANGTSSNAPVDIKEEYDEHDEIIDERHKKMKKDDGSKDDDSSSSNRTITKRITKKGKTRQKRFIAGKHGPMNHNIDPNSKFSKYLKRWTLLELVKIDALYKKDDPNQDPILAAIMVDFLKRIEINSDRLTNIQEVVEDIYGRLNTLKSNNRDGDTSHIERMMDVCNDQRRTLRNLQRLHFDTWDKTFQHYVDWSPDGDDDIDNDTECDEPVLQLDPIKRRNRWSKLIENATEIQARHAMTIEQMAEICISMKPLSRKSSTNPILKKDDDESFQKDLVRIYDTVCAFMRCRMTQQLMCQHFVAVSQQAMSSSSAKPQQKKQSTTTKEKPAAGPSYENYEQQTVSSDKTVGVIDVDTPVINVVRGALEEATALCDATYMIAPASSFLIAIEDTKFKEEGIKAYPSITNQTRTTEGIHETSSATFVRAWFQYTMIELLKNAMAATVDNNPDLVKALVDTDSDSDSDSDDEMDNKVVSPPQHLPMLYIHIFDSPCGEYTMIRIHDQGGGIPETIDLEKFFQFAQRDTVWDPLDEQGTRDPLRGLGVGLSLSRWHMRHFGGDLLLERRDKDAVRVRSTEAGRRGSSWTSLDKGMTATIRIPKNSDISLAIS